MATASPELPLRGMRYTPATRDDVVLGGATVGLEAAGDPAKTADITKVRDDFETPWVVWNVVRTVAVTAGFVCLTRAVFGRVRVRR